MLTAARKRNIGEDLLKFENNKYADYWRRFSEISAKKNGPIFFFPSFNYLY